MYVQIVYLDFSPTSLATAQSRAEARNLKNILWVILNKVLPIRIHIVSKFHSFLFVFKSYIWINSSKKIHDKIENLPSLDLGHFDFINCYGKLGLALALVWLRVFTGVLHHLKDPKAGLTILASLLKEDGGMQLMVYAW